MVGSNFRKWIMSLVYSLQCLMLSRPVLKEKKQDPKVSVGDFQWVV